jgi:hypothetical protein
MHRSRGAAAKAATVVLRQRAFSDWRAGRPFDSDAFVRDLKHMHDALDRPEFIVLPLPDLPPSPSRPAQASDTGPRNDASGRARSEAGCTEGCNGCSPGKGVREGGAGLRAGAARLAPLRRGDAPPRRREREAGDRGRLQHAAGLYDLSPGLAPGRAAPVRCHRQAMGGAPFIPSAQHHPQGRGERTASRKGRAMRSPRRCWNRMVVHAARVARLDDAGRIDEIYGPVPARA